MWTNCELRTRNSELALVELVTDRAPSATQHSNTSTNSSRPAALRGDDGAYQYREEL